MRVLLLADADFAYREHEMLRRVQIGLLDEGIVAQRAVAMSTPRLDAFGEDSADIVRFQDGGPSLTLSIRARRLVRALEERADAPAGDDRLVDVVHAFGQRAWAMGRALAKATGAALCCEVHGLPEVSALRATEHAAARALGAGAPITWVVPDPGLVEPVEQASGKANVRLAPWGVHVPSEPPRQRDPTRPLALAIIADPSSKDHPNALLEALGGFDPDAVGLPPGARDRAREQTVSTTPGDEGSPGGEPRADDELEDPWTLLPERPMVFVDEASRLWLARAGRLDVLGLRDRITLTPSLAANRTLALRCDAIILPTPTGVLRSIMLDAMAAGVRIIGARDPAIDVLRDGDTAFLTDARQPDTSGWREVLDRAFPEGVTENPLAVSARVVLRSERLAAHQIAELIHLYGEIAGPPPAIAFNDTGGGSKNANA